MSPNEIAMSIIKEFLSDGVPDEYWEGFDSVTGETTAQARTIVDGLLRSLLRRVDAL